jgi:soluble lytic murein transglycosylase-like protein
VERLRFGRRARRRARWRRLTIGAWLVTMAGTSLGVPTGMGFLGGLGEAPIDSPGVQTSDTAASLLRFRSSVFSARPDRPERDRQEPERRRKRAKPAGMAEATPPSEPPSVTEIVYAAAAEHGVDPAYLLSVAECESGLDPGAGNGAGYYGLFQFDEETWAAYGYGSIYDPAAQADTAAALLAAGHSSRWPNCA